MELEREVVAALEWRYATKQFDRGRRLSEAQWAALEAALLLTPSAFGLQPWRFALVQDPSLRSALMPHSHGQVQVEECSHLVVFAALDTVDGDYIERVVARTADVRGVPVASLHGYRTMLLDKLRNGHDGISLGEWAARQVYIAVGTLVSAAAALRIDACPLEGIDTHAYDTALGLPGTGYHTLLACALGHRNPGDRYAHLAKVRFAREEMVIYR